MWLGTANDWVIVVQFLTFIPVALALRGWLPPTRSVRLATAASARWSQPLSCSCCSSGVLEFDVQVLLAWRRLVYTWVLTASSATATAHRLVGDAVGLLLGASSGRTRHRGRRCWGSAAQLAFVGPGIAIAAFGWLGGWPLVLAQWVRAAANRTSEGNGRNVMMLADTILCGSGSPTRCRGIDLRRHRVGLTCCSCWTS